MIIVNPGQFIGHIDLQAKLTLVGGSGTPNRERLFTSFGLVAAPMGEQISWGQVTGIRINVDIKYQLGPEKISTPLFAQFMPPGEHHKSALWLVNYGENGVSFDPQGSTDVGSSPGDQQVTVAAQLSNQSQNSHESDFGFVSLIVQMAGNYSDEGVTINSPSVGVLPTVSAGGVGKSASSFSLDVPIKAHILAVGRPQSAKLVLLPDELLTHTVYFDELGRPGTSPGEGKAFMSSEELRNLREKWVDQLRTRAPELFAAITGGRIHIQLDGFASTTGKGAADADLSYKRAVSVREAIRTQIRPNQKLIFKVAAHGHRNATMDGPVPQEKRVEISIEKSEATKAIEDMRKRL